MLKFVPPKERIYLVMHIMKTDHSEGKRNCKASLGGFSGIKDVDRKLKSTKPVPFTNVVDTIVVVVLIIHCRVVFLLTPWLSDKF